MYENRYRLAGWLAVIQAVLFPVMIFLGVIESAVSRKFFDIRVPSLGPSDLLMIPLAIFAIYCLVRFRSLLHERYDFSRVDGIITAAIWWQVWFAAFGLLLGVFSLIFSHYSEEMIVILFAIFFGISMVAAGVIDIIFGVKLLQVPSEKASLVRAYAILTLIMGVAEVTIILSFLTLFLFPVSAVILAIIFFRDDEVPEFV